MGIPLDLYTPIFAVSRISGGGEARCHRGRTTRLCHWTAAQAQSDCGWQVVVCNGDGAGGGGEGRVNRVGEVDSEGFVRLVGYVAIDEDRYRLARFARVESQRGAGDRHVVGRSGGRAVRGGEVDGDRFSAGGREGHGEVCSGGSTVTLGDRHIIDGERRNGIIVADGVGVGGEVTQG